MKVDGPLPVWTQEVVKEHLSTEHESLPENATAISFVSESRHLSLWAGSV